MRIGRIRVENFKSLVAFDLSLAKFTCLIGLNGSGKSTVLQFLDFMGRQVVGNIEGWLDDRGWRPREVASKLQPKKNIEFTVEVLTDDGERFAEWKANYNPSLMYCTSEAVVLADARLEVAGGEYTLSTTDNTVYVREPITREQIAFDYQGSILSQLRNDRLPEPLVAFKRFFRNIHSLDMLSPDFLRSRTREAGGTLGIGGKQLAAFLHEMDWDDHQDLVGQLKKVYPQLVGLDTKSLRSGWKQLDVREHFRGGPSITTGARHVNDGMLRLIAILAELTTDHDMVMFDEIENGINPELVEFLIDSLTNARQQVLVTTHSPLILNYLDDDTARRGVMYLYKTAQGYTQSIPFFSIGSVAEKLTVMGPGEAFVDTNLTELAKEIAGMARAGTP